MSHASWAYSLYGLAVRSNFPIPGLPEGNCTPGTPDSPDVDIFLGVSPGETSGLLPPGEEVSYTSDYTDESGQPALVIWSRAGGALLRFAYSDGHQFWMDGEGKKVWAEWPAHSSIEQVAPYLLGPVFGVLLRYRGVTCLHASAAALDGQAVAFVGAAGSGKSTTAAALVMHGWTALADDITALSEKAGEFYATPAYPSLNLWPDSVRLLYGDQNALPTIFPGCDKRTMSLSRDAQCLASEPLPLRAVYLLEGRGSGDAFEVQGIERQAALVSLVANTYATKTINTQIRAQEFSLLGKLVSSVAVRRLLAGRDTTNLNHFAEFITQDLGLSASRVLRPGDR